MSIVILSGVGFMDSIKIDVRSVSGNSYVHKQIERRGGLTFMRLKKRKIR